MKKQRQARTRPKQRTLLLRARERLFWLFDWLKQALTFDRKRSLWKELRDGAGGLLILGYVAWAAVINVAGESIIYLAKSLLRSLLGP